MSAAPTPSRKTPAKASSKKRQAKTSPAKPKTRAKARAKTPVLEQPVEVKAPVAQTTLTPVATPEPAPAITDEQISQRAYDIWIEKGRPYGQEDANWQQAVAELLGE